MNCHEFEYKLWEEPGKYREKQQLPQAMADHIESCSACESAYEEYVKIFALARQSELSEDDAYWGKFGNKVWQKIDAIKADTRLPEKTQLLSRYNLGFGQLIASLGVAAATVAMLMLAVSNITDEPQIADMMGRAEKKMAPPAPDFRTQAPARTYNVILGSYQKGGLEIKEFSLLPQPEVNVVDDSALVSIDAAYLTDEGLEEEDLEVTSALSKETVMGTGMADTTMPKLRADKVEVPESDYVITVEKMPKMLKAVPPNYPAFAYKLKRGGEVWIKAHVDANGDVQQALIHRDSGTDYGFEESALVAAYKNKFEPFEVNGKKIPVWVIYKVRFVATE